MGSTLVHCATLLKLPHYVQILMFLPSLAAFHDYELNFSVSQDINISVYSLLQTEKEKPPHVVS